MLVAALLLGGVAFLLLGGWPVADGENRSELLSTDWNLEWMRLQADRRRADDSFEWDKRARHFRPLETAPYARDFIKLLALSTMGSRIALRRLSLPGTMIGIWLGRLPRLLMLPLPVALSPRPT